MHPLHKAAIYIRVSTEEQAQEGYSLAKQERDCRLKAERLGLEVYKVYADDETGRRSSRTDFNKLLAEVKAKPRRFDVIIVHNLDRIMRDLYLLLSFKRRLDAAQIRLVSATEDIDTDTDDGIMMFQFKGMLAERYSRNLSRETKKGLTEKAQQGHWVGGICPYGYRRADKDTIVPANDASTAAVRQIFDWYQTGRHSYADVADMANTLSCGRSFGVEAIRDILSNRAYIGFVSSGGQEFRGRHEAIISPDVWQRCADLRASRATKQHDANHPKPRHNPRGILLDVGCCADCDQKLWQRISGNRASRSGYYMCAGKSRRNCNAKMSNIDVTDEAVLDLLRGFALAVEWQRDAIEQTRTITIQPAAPVVDRQAVMAKIDRLSIAWTNGNLSDDAYEKQLAALKEQLAQQAHPAPKVFDLSAAAAVVTNLGTLIEAATIQERRELVTMLFEQVWVREGGNIHAVQPKALYGVLWRQTIRLYNSERETGISAPEWNRLHSFRKTPIWTTFGVAAAS